MDSFGESLSWEALRELLGGKKTAWQPLRAHLTPTVQKIWQKLGSAKQSVLQLLSGFDISAQQVGMLMEGATEPECNPEELLTNPYFASTCTYGMDLHVPFLSIDRALFPPTHVKWSPSMPAEVRIEDHLDRRRVEALLTDVLECHGVQGDTLLPEHEAIDAANGYELSRPPNLAHMVLEGLDLDHDSLVDQNEWSPITGVGLANGAPGMKLTR
jgi:hypothetical protein